MFITRRSGSALQPIVRQTTLKNIAVFSTQASWRFQDDPTKPPKTLAKTLWTKSYQPLQKTKTSFQAKMVSKQMIHTQYTEEEIEEEELNDPVELYAVFCTANIPAEVCAKFNKHFQ